MNKVQLATHALRWFKTYGRHHLPWQHPRTPYRVWLSEVMLQQTQVATVIPYFNTFIKRFPTLSDLASADLDDVLHLWAGLGYYSRARNLHRCAQRIADDYEGHFPNTLSELEALPGIGRSTAGAILTQAFNQPAAILDGNVKRVLARVYGINGWPGETRNHERLWTLAETHAQVKRPADYTQAMMDLGAMVCIRKKPLCHICPLMKLCDAFQRNQTDIIPASKPKKHKPSKMKFFLMIENASGEVLVEKQPSPGIWGGLYSLPQAEHLDNLLNLHSEYITDELHPVAPFKHSFSHYHLLAYPLWVRSNKNHPIPQKDSAWIHPSKPITLGLPAPIQKLLMHFK